MKLLFFIVAAALVLPAGVAARDIVFAGGGWAAIDRGGLCEAATRALTIKKGRPPALARFTFSRDRRRWGEFSTRLGRIPRSGSSVMLRIGNQRFLLAARSGSAWSRGAMQEQALIAAVRGGGAMRIEGRDAAGRRFTDHYALAGGATAIDAAAARCAGKIARE